MRGLWLEQGRARLRTDLERPQPSEGECRVRVLAAGVCATDLALLRGYMSFRGVPGHEFVGEALDGPLAGRRVVGEINAGCGRCPRCAAGDPRHCPERSVLGILGRSGAFAEELALPARNLQAVPDEVSTTAATFTEPLAAALAIGEQVALKAHERAIVVGDGRLGLLCAQVLARAGLAVDVVGRHPERARLARSASETGPRWVQRPEPATLVVEASGRPDGLADALRLVVPRGTLVLKTTTEAPVALDLAGLVVNEITLVGSRCGRFEPALAALAGGGVEVEGMVDARLPLEEAPRALELAARPGVLKVLIDVSGGSRPLVAPRGPAYPPHAP